MDQLGAVGHQPGVVVRPTEKALYTRLWEHPEYRKFSPGEFYVNQFLLQARPQKGATLLDLGCGTGRAGLALALVGGLDVTLVDFAPNCLDADVREIAAAQPHALRFVEADLTKDIPCAAVYGLCADTMEHIPTAQVDAALDHILRACQHVFFSIATGEDKCGELVGHRLHLTQRPYAWWLRKLQERDCHVHWSRDLGWHALFYATAWVDAAAVVDVGVLNVGEEDVRRNVRYNVAQGWQQVHPHETNAVELVVVGGGPSAADRAEEIRRLRADGAKLVTLNGAYHWCLAHGLTPSAHVVVDARPFNARFTRPVVDGCKYFVASQCDPAVFEGLPVDRTYIWHTTADMIREILDAQYDAWWGIPGGSTALLRAIPLFRMLGFTRYHLFGCDSCLAPDGAHHAYDQPENGREAVMNVTCGGRVFRCHAWMAAQAQEFVHLIKVFGNEIELAVYGDGLLAHVLKTGAALHEESVLLQ